MFVPEIRVNKEVQLVTANQRTARLVRIVFVDRKLVSEV